MSNNFRPLNFLQAACLGQKLQQSILSHVSQILRLAKNSLVNKGRYSLNLSKRKITESFSQLPNIYSFLSPGTAPVRHLAPDVP